MKHSESVAPVAEGSAIAAQEPVAAADIRSRAPRRYGARTNLASERRPHIVGRTAPLALVQRLPTTWQPGQRCRRQDVGRTRLVVLAALAFAGWVVLAGAVVTGTPAATTADSNANTTPSQVSAVTDPAPLRMTVAERMGS